jgi:hypothetical protein
VVAELPALFSVTELDTGKSAETAKVSASAGRAMATAATIAIPKSAKRLIAFHR